MIIIKNTAFHLGTKRSEGATHLQEPVLGKPGKMNEPSNDQGSRNNEEVKNLHPLTPVSPDLTFPWRLFAMLENSTVEGFDEVVSWISTGDAFKVHNPEKFAADILPRFFQMKKYGSFTRQLHAYSFTRIRTGPSKGGYCHPRFSKHNPSHCFTIERRRKKGSAKNSSNTTTRLQGQAVAGGDERQTMPALQSSSSLSSSPRTPLHEDVGDPRREQGKENDSNFASARPHPTMSASRDMEQVVPGRGSLPNTPHSPSANCTTAFDSSGTAKGRAGNSTHLLSWGQQQQNEHEPQQQQYRSDQTTQSSSSSLTLSGISDAVFSTAASSLSNSTMSRCRPPHQARTQGQQEQAGRHINGMYWNHRNELLSANELSSYSAAYDEAVTTRNYEIVATVQSYVEELPRVQEETTPGAGPEPSPPYNDILLNGIRQSLVSFSRIEPPDPLNCHHGRILLSAEEEAKSIYQEEEGRGDWRTPANTTVRPTSGGEDGVGSSEDCDHLEELLRNLSPRPIEEMINDPLRSLFFP